MISKSLDETKKIAEEFVGQLKPQVGATVVAMKGDLGSGKTTFSQFVGDVLGVKSALRSPTFLIEKIYELEGKPWQHLIHIDAYRLESEQELLNLGWREIVQRPGNLILVEWAEKIESILPESSYHILFRHGEDEKERDITVGPA